MTSLIKSQSQFRLTPERRDGALKEIARRLSGRVEAAYVFGSAASDDTNLDSDIDLLFVVKTSDIPFVQRGFEFKDLFEVYPKLDILVYTQAELDQQLADSSVGFWRSVRTSMKRLI